MEEGRNRGSGQCRYRRTAMDRSRRMRPERKRSSCLKWRVREAGFAGRNVVLCRDEDGASPPLPQLVLLCRELSGRAKEMSPLPQTQDGGVWRLKGRGHHGKRRESAETGRNGCVRVRWGRTKDWIEKF